jgi:arylsulfatase A-like enzyme
MRLCVVASILLLSSSAVAADKPNVVLIFADDLGINDLHCYGREDHATPNLDRLASEGARFTSAYCSLSICSASRAGLITGKSPARLHITTYLPGRLDAPTQKLLHPVIPQQLALEETTLAERLKVLGYATGCIGKWHLGGKGFLPTDQGFDEYVDTPANTDPSATEGGKGEYAITAKAIDFIARHKSEPFFLYVPHNNPHVVLTAKPELIEKHKDAFNPIYAAMIETLDDSVGQILAALREQKLDDNTIVIFTADNGGLHVVETPNTPATHNTPFRAGKGYLYEGGLRIPAIIRWPGKISPQVIDWPMVNLDWLPTLVEFCGGDVPGDIDGASIAGPLLGKSKAPADRTFFFHFPHYTNQGGRPAGAVRDGKWKLVAHYDTGRVELFDLSTDRAEQNDIAAQQVDRVHDMHGRLGAWRKQIGAQENVLNPDYDEAAAKEVYVDIDTSNISPRRTAAETAPLYESWRKKMNAALRPRK